MSTISMYSLPPVFSPCGPLSLPTCMYSLPKIQGQLEDPSVAESQCSLTELEARQGRLLDRLSELQQKVASARRDLGLKPPSDNNVSRARSSVSVSSVCALRETAFSPLSTCSFSSSVSSSMLLLQSPLGERRKNKILEQISAIKATLQQLKTVWNDVPPKPVVQKREGPLVLVVRANPTHPPYGLLCMVRELITKDKLLLETSCHSHSSLWDPLPQHLVDFLPPTNCQDKAKLSLKMFLIWSNVDRDPECVIGQNVIRGEADIARFLSRSFTRVFNYENGSAVTASITDELIDSCYSRLVCGGKSATEEFVKNLEERLKHGKSSLLGSEKLGFADFLIWSALVNSGQQKQSASLKQWMQACERVSGRAPSQTKCSRGGEGKKGNKADPKSKKLFEFLSSNGISYDNVDHPEVFTVDAMMPYLGKVQGAVTKNLFLKDGKSKKLYLLSALHDRDVNLSEVSKKIKARSDLRFGDEKVMLEVLGVQQGCVTAFALLNDVKHEVNFLVDEAIVDGSYAKVYFHPLVNSATTGISCADFKRFLEKTGHDFTPIQFS